MFLKYCLQLLPKCTPIYKPSILRNNLGAFHTTTRALDLMEFFENQKNLGKDEIRVGRSWRVSELRKKSNSDLHKLWYILLKEKNMLLTMEHYCKENYNVFPNPERIDKVEESMKNVETTIRERNKAYFELETGESGERPGKVIYDPIGLKHWHRMTQHIVPKHMNTYWKENSFQGFDPEECDEFLRLYKEKNISRHIARRKEEKKYVRGLIKRFPNMDIEHLQKQYPHLNIKKYVTNLGNEGHFVERGNSS